MARRSAAWPLTLAAIALIACGELNVAKSPAEPSDGTDGASNPTDDGADDTMTPGKEGGAGPTDAAKKDATSPPVVCDGPCPPEMLVEDLHQATALTVDVTNIYFAVEGGSGNGTVYQCPKTGCGAGPIVLGEGYAAQIVVGGGVVYWGDFSAGKVQSCAVGGCSNAPTPVASNQPSIKGVATDDSDLFWSTNGAIKHCVRTSCSTASAETITTGQAFIQTMAAAQGKVVWPSSGKVYSAPVGPSQTPTELGPGSIDVSIHANDVFWVNGTTKTISKCALTGCNQTPVTIGSSSQPRFPVSDGTHVYWRDEFLSQIYRCPNTGCTPGPDIIAKQQDMQPDGQIALDGEYIYWTTVTGVYRLHK